MGVQLLQYHCSNEFSINVMVLWGSNWFGINVMGFNVMGFQWVQFQCHGVQCYVASYPGSHMGVQCYEVQYPCYGSNVGRPPILVEGVPLLTSYIQLERYTMYCHRFSSAMPSSEGVWAPEDEGCRPPD